MRLEDFYNIECDSDCDIDDNDFFTKFEDGEESEIHTQM